jgi:two-component system, chemotaxis family, chemotaxis protein CheY
MQLHRLRFLIVDSSATSRRILHKLLREIGPVEVEELADGRGALAWLAAERCDFIVAEAEGPLLEGFELLRALRRDPALRALPALLVMKEARKELVVRAARVGASGYLVRPLTRAALEDKILSILGLPAQAATRWHGASPPLRAAS